MATHVQSLENRLPQRVLEIDGLFELILGAGLLLASESVARWIGVDGRLLAIAGILTMGVGGFLLYFARRQATRPTLQLVALLNLAWTVGSGLVLALDWNALANEGRWLIVVVADMTLIMGVVELYARHHTV
jgi:hypothetical protein